MQDHHASSANVYLADHGTVTKWTNSRTSQAAHLCKPSTQKHSWGHACHARGSGCSTKLQSLQHGAAVARKQQAEVSMLALFRADVLCSLVVQVQSFRFLIPPKAILCNCGANRMVEW
jgi:hypothetical protein